MMKIALIVLSLPACQACCAPAGTAVPLELQVVQRPPYLMLMPDGGFDGISVRPAMAAFKKAGIPVVWKEVPTLRQLQRLKSNQERVCSVGWYKTRERGQFAKFTRAVSQDSPWVAFANSGFALPRQPSVRSILADSRVTVLLKTGFVYGEFLDKAMLAMQAQRMETHADMPQLLRMIEIGRAQITFAPMEEIQYYLSNTSVDAGVTRILTFSEMPAGYKRYLMCSRLVDDGLIARFNAALRAQQDQN